MIDIVNLFHSTTVFMNSPRSTRPSLRAVPPELLLLPSIALILSCIMTWATIGFGPEFLARWARGFFTTLLVLPFVLVCVGALDKQAGKFLAGWHWIARKLVVAAITAVMIETVLAFAITAVGHPFDATFVNTWWLAFSRSLPVGMLIGLFMSFYMKPRLDKMRQAARAARIAQAAANTGA